MGMKRGELRKVGSYKKLSTFLQGLSYHCMARANLGVLEANAGNMEASRKHFMISAAQGNDNALMMIRDGYMNGRITKDDYAKALRAHKDAQDEIRSEHRTKAKAARMSHT